MTVASSSDKGRSAGLRRMLLLIADLLAGKELDRVAAVRRTNLKPAAVDRQLRIILNHVPGVVAVPDKRPLTIRFDKSTLEEMPPYPTAIAACLGASLSKLFEGSSYENGIAAAFTYVVQRTRHRKVFRDIERKFAFVRQGGEVSLPEKAAALDDLLEGILRQKRCRISYLPFEDPAEVAEVIEPLSVVIYDHQLYIIGRSETEGVKLYRFSRIGSVEVTATTFVYPPRMEYDPEQLFASSFGIFIGRDFSVEDIEIRLAPRWTNYARTHRWHCSQQIAVNRDGVDVRLHARVCPELEQWVLSFGEEIEVLKPLWLREKIAERIARMAGIYPPRAPGRDEARSVL